MTGGGSDEPVHTRWHLREIFEVPNLVSLTRLPLGAAAWIDPANAWLVSAILAAGSTTDLLDGWLARRAARRRNPHNPRLPEDHLGAWLDPVCDKAFVVSVLLAVWLTRGTPWWIALVAATREILIVTAWIARAVIKSIRERTVPSSARVLGKATTVSQMVLLVAVVWGRETWAPWLGIAAGALGLAASIDYFVRAVRGARA